MASSNHAAADPVKNWIAKSDLAARQEQEKRQTRAAASAGRWKRSV